MKYEITVSCCMCSENYETTIGLPDGWTSRYESVDDENGFCPKHQLIAEWAASQCPGCVSGWGDCPLHQDFAYNKLKLTAFDFDSIAKGICPRRTNGTMLFNGGQVEQIDLSDTATSESGEVLVRAIKDYSEIYHMEKARAEAKTEYLQKYLEYIDNTGGVTVEQFDEDWEPIGEMVRLDLYAADLAFEKDGQLVRKP